MANKRIKGITIEINGDTTKLSKSLREVDRTISQTQTKLRDVEKLLKFNPASSELLKQKQQALGTEINATKQKLDAEKKALEELEKNADGTKENAEQQAALKREIIETTSKLEHLEKQAAKASSVLGTQMQVAGKKVAETGDKIISAGKSLSKISAPIAGIGVAAVKTTADFDASMSKVAAVSGATGKDFDALREKAREMGEKTKFSAAESADAMNYMAMAGWKTEDMLGGISGIMNLAAASGEDLATTSDIVTDALTAFGQSADQSGRLADIMAAASSNANTNVKMMGETFKYAAPVAGALGFSMEDTAVAIGMMANAGIKSSQAGTALRTGLTNLVKPTDQMAAAMDRYGISVTNQDGSMKSMAEVMTMLREKLGGLGESEQASAAAAIFGKNAMSGWLAIVNGSQKDFDKLTSAVDNSNGSAEKMAGTMNDNLSGQLTILKSQLSEAAISIGDTLMPTIKNLTNTIQGLVDKFNSLDDKQKNTILKFAGIAAAIGPATVAVGSFVKGVGNIATGVGKAISGISSLLVKLGLKTVAETADTAAQTANTTATAANTAAETANTAAQTANAAAQGTSAAATTASGAAAGAASGGFLALNASMLPTILIIGGIVLAVAAIIAVIVLLVKNWDKVVAAFKKGAEKVKAFMSNMKDKITGLFKNIGAWFGKKFGEAVTKIKEKFGKIGDFFNTIKEKLRTVFSKIGTTIGGAISGAFKRAINGALSIVEGYLNMIPNAINGVLGLINKLLPKGSKLGKIPTIQLPRVALAEGGVATSATNAIIGEGKHPEAVLPLGDPRTVELFRKALAGAGNGATVNQTINVGQMSSYREAYMIRRATEQGIKRMMRA